LHIQPFNAYRFYTEYVISGIGIGIGIGIGSIGIGGVGGIVLTLT